MLITVYLRCECDIEPCVLQPYFQPVPAPPAPFSNNAALHDPSFPSGLRSAWAVTITQSSNIFIFGTSAHPRSLSAFLDADCWTAPSPHPTGAGLYSFFDNYGQDCLTTTSCQQQIFNIDNDSTVSVYGLSTVGTTWQLSVNGQGVIPASANANGFAQTTTSWSR